MLRICLGHAFVALLTVILPHLTFLVMTKTARVWNEDRADFNPCAFTRVSVSQFQLPSSEHNWGYSWGDKIASKKITSGSCSSRKTSKHVCLSTHHVLHKPGSLLCEDSGKKSLTVSSNSLCLYGLLDRKRCASFIVDTRPFVLHRMQRWTGSSSGSSNVYTLPVDSPLWS